MKLNNSYFFTLREDVKDEDSISGNLLVRSGMVKKSSSGIYMFLPLGYKVLKNIEQVIREEMNGINSQELLMPSLITENVFEQSGRKSAFGSSIFTLSDRFDKEYILGPTHEELFAIASSMKIKSYKDLPFSLYQIQNKFRDEARPRYGLIRVREFLMKDAYTFDKDLEGLDKSYNDMFEAYKRIFDRLEVDVKIVKADTGAMGGLLSEEFQAVTEIGEDVLVLSDSSDYASNLEIAEVINNIVDNEEKLAYEKIHTPNVKTAKDVANFLDKDLIKVIKNLIYKIDGELYLVLIPGNRELNETKLLKTLKKTIIEAATEEEINELGTKLGFIGPIGLNIPVVLDRQVASLNNFVVGANEVDYHYKNVNTSDFEYITTADITNVLEGDKALDGGTLYFKKGIEVGNTFKLGTKYAESFNLKYSDETNNLQTVYMGSYGIGLGRIMSALVEQKHDEKGIVWPVNVAPYKVAIIVLNNDYEEQANELYKNLTNLGIDTLLDDRNERAGVKFNDIDLIGIPYRIVIGKKASEGLVEFKGRLDTESVDIQIEEVINLIKEKTK